MVKNISGQRFGRLTAIEFTGKTKNRKALWLCKCDCGNDHIAISGNLMSGTTQSCGCYKREAIITSNKKNKVGGSYHTTHGLSVKEKRLYEVWTGMKARCECKTNKRYEDYGGRGIALCEEWHDFARFAEWARSSGYDANAPRGVCTIDRIDNDKGYDPDNCRWVTVAEQNRNRRNTNGV